MIWRTRDSNLRWARRQRVKSPLRSTATVTGPELLAPADQALAPERATRAAGWYLLRDLNPGSRDVSAQLWAAKLRRHETESGLITSSASSPRKRGPIRRARADLALQSP